VKVTSTSPLSVDERDRLLMGWGRTAPSRATVATPQNYDDVSAAIINAGPRGVLARGLGRSYGDAAQSGGATVFDMTGLRRFDLDIESGTLTADAGASIDEILRAIVPAGFFVPVTAGTRFVTVGGAIAADIHGKNHHVEGSFGSHVTAMTVIDGSGEVRTLSPDDPVTQEMFWATVGGMGLTGVIVEATFSLLPIETSGMSVDTVRCSDLDDVMTRMVEGDDDYRYSVAWIDTVAASGRGVLTRGDHARRDQLSGKQAGDPLAYVTPSLPSAPAFVPNGLLNSASVRAFNEAWFRKHPKNRVGEVQSIPAFFHPLDGVRDWNRVYGPQGFLQYQFVVPDSAGWIVERTLRRLRDVGAPSFLTVLKRFGPANPAPLSFPQAGWTLAADVPAGIDALGPVLDELDELVASEGGRLYFAKDSRQSPSMVARTYPRLAEWQAVRDVMDPRGVFTSDLGRRLSL
jgi:decaprenylphospho-beta-D-ribofuranose 2-oxidase